MLKQTSQKRHGMKRNSSKNEDFKNKKRKTKGDAVTLSFLNLPKNANDSSLNDFVRNSGLNLKIKSCRANYMRRKAFVDFNSWEVERALKLHNTLWMGTKIIVSVDGQLPPEPETTIDDSDDEPETRYTLFCKNLPFDATAMELSNLFEDVEEVRVVYSNTTRHCKGFAYVDFKSEEALRSAFALNGNLEYRGRRLFLDNSVRSGAHTEDPTASRVLVVRGITDEMNECLLMQHFKGAKSAQIVKKHGTDEILAYVEFESTEAAAQIYEEHQGTVDIDDVTVLLEYAEKFSAESHDNGRTILCVRNIPMEMSEKNLIESFKDAVHAIVIRDGADGKSKGFGYLKFPTEKEAEEVYKSSKFGWDVDGVKLRVTFAKREAQSRKLCVSGITSDIDENRVTRFFKGATGAYIVKNPSKPTSIAFVKFPSELDALRSLHQHRGSVEICGQKLTVYGTKVRSGKGNTGPGSYDF